MPDSATTKRQKYDEQRRLEALGVEINTSLVHRLFLDDLKTFRRHCEAAVKRVVE